MECNTDDESQVADTSSLNFVTPNYQRIGHPRSRRRRSRITYNLSPDRLVQSPYDSGYEPSPSSVTNVRTFSFENNMPNSMDLNGHRGSNASEDLDSPSGDQPRTPPIPIRRPSGEVFYPTPFSLSPSNRSSFLTTNPVALMASAQLTRPRGVSAPPAYNFERRNIATQTDQPNVAPEIQVHPPSVRRRRASAATMDAPLPDVVSSSVRPRRPRSLSTCSFPGLDAQGHLMTPHEEDEYLLSTVGSRLRSLSDAFDESHANNIMLLQNSI